MCVCVCACAGIFVLGESKILLIYLMKVSRHNFQAAKFYFHQLRKKNSIRDTMNGEQLKRGRFRFIEMEKAIIQRCHNLDFSLEINNKSAKNSRTHSHYVLSNLL